MLSMLKSSISGINSTARMLIMDVMLCSQLNALSVYQSQSACLSALLEYFISIMCCQTIYAYCYYTGIVDAGVGVRTP